MIADDINTLAFPLIGISSLVAALVFVIKRIKNKDAMDEDIHLQPLPGPLSIPLLGSAHVIGRYSKPWEGFSALRKKYGDIYGVKLGSVNCVVLSSIDGMKEVLLTKGKQFENRMNSLRFNAIFKGNRNFSIALCDWSAKQKTRRKIACPFMHPRTTSVGGEKMNVYIRTELEDLVRTLQPLQNQVIEPRYYLLIAAGNIFFQFLCSKRFSPKDEMFLKIIKTYDAVFQNLFQSFSVDFMPWLKAFNTKKLQILEEMAEALHEFAEMIFKERRESRAKPGDLIDLFMEHVADNASQDDGKLTQADIEIIVDDLLGGQSVLANSWIWGLYFLADHPEVRSRIRKEVTEVTGNTRYSSMEDVGSMPYTFATVMELLRIISSPIIPHVAAEDTSIMGYKVCKDTMVLFNTIDINMNPQYWEHPRLFKPERFLDVEGKFRKPDYFFPFSMGKRSCLGDALVKSTLFLGFSTLLQCFDICLPPDSKGPSTYDVPGDVLPKEEIKLVFKTIT